MRLGIALAAILAVAGCAGTLPDGWAPGALLPPPVPAPADAMSGIPTFPADCGTPELIFRDRGDAGETPVVRGVFNNGDLMVIVVNPAGEWSVVIVNRGQAELRVPGGRFLLPAGTACVVDQGFGLQITEPDLGA